MPHLSSVASKRLCILVTYATIARMRIGISGAKGSFSEEAARLYRAKFLVSNEENDLAYLTVAEEVLQALENGDVELGIFAIENSNGGVVTEYLPAIGRHRFEIEKIFEMDVHHHLLVRPGTKAADIATIASQGQALKQCRMYLKRSWPAVELQEYIDTATAARDLHEEKLDPATTAVIAPAICAELYDLETLESSIQDLKFNFTTFIAAKPLT